MAPATRFEVEKEFLDRYNVQQAGKTILEYWIPPRTWRSSIDTLSAASRLLPNTGEDAAERILSANCRCWDDAAMQAATSLAVDLEPLLPLRITTVEFHYGTLVVVGEKWSLALLGDWTWRRDGVAVTDWEQPTAEDAVWDLCGLELIGVHFPDPAYDGDCSFILSDGSLDVRSDRNGYETWTYRHQDLDVVHVGL